jgi:hypothetical protein
MVGDIPVATHPAAAAYAQLSGHSGKVRRFCRERGARTGVAEMLQPFTKAGVEEIVIR